MISQKVWLVTGASSGLGLATVKQLLKHGYKVAATSRNAEELASEVKDTSGNFLPLEIQVTNVDSIKDGISKIINQFGRIDVTINNAGYALLGSIEELTNEEIKANYEVNVFGVMNVTRAVMSIYRKQNSGYFINIASISGSVTGSGLGIYSATKAAVIMLTEAVDDEGREFGVRATAVCPGGFKTNFLSGRSARFPQSPIAEYHSVRQAEKQYGRLNQNQGGDPNKAALVFMELANSQDPPKRLYLGSDGYRGAEYKLQYVHKDLEKWQNLSLSTDFDY